MNLLLFDEDRIISIMHTEYTLGQPPIHANDEFYCESTVEFMLSWMMETGFGSATLPW